MESNGSGGDNPERFGGSGPPNRDTNPPIYLRVVNISKPEMAYISDNSGTRRLAILVPADQPINAGNMGASNVDSSNVNIGNQNLVNNYSTSGYEDPNPTMPNPELPDSFDPNTYGDGDELRRR
ncbi:hypothetical protein RF11_14201 [Thelohanellus kitauei]|uniref:Uncharacterized protein n=1 Tax=Thelohanellus kitauei TaxID=669202 RepID=A0A0C2JPH6_THEKT|nr:hypothetical protein RF11_14201 [Thelohanellus kitauei]